MPDKVNSIVRLFETWGGDSYSELVSQTAHAEQCAALAAAHSADDSLVIAALLHDLGHLLVLDTNAGRTQLDSDDEHEATGARELSRIFGPNVAGPVALHVAAKRYLCATDAAYHATLSPASVASLAMQGGPMTQPEVERFERSPRFTDAVALRKWDDEAKVAGKAVAAFASYVPVMEDLAQRWAQS